MGLIDGSYFLKRLLAVPNVAQVAVAENLNNYLVEFEDQYLDKMLGVKLKHEFLTGLDAPAPEQRWLDLRDGKEYEVSGIIYRWRGFVNSDKVSPIANYVFCKYTPDNETLNTGDGDVKKSVENGTFISPHYRIAQVWNEMVKLNWDLFNFLTEFGSDYESWGIPEMCSPLLSKDNGIGF